MIIKGKALKYEENDINTDVIWPGKYTYVQMESSKMRDHAMETFDPEFKQKTKDILVAGKNFGCGSSREQASECLKYSGVKAIIAKSFSRIFYRNSINLGLPVVQSEEAVEVIGNGDEVYINLEKGMISVKERHFTFATYPKFIMELIQHGGLIKKIKYDKKGE